MRLTDLSLLEAFVEVAQTRSFSKAAVKLHTSLPSISKKIKQLEVDLGMSLFQRTTRSVNLTSDGELALPAAKSVLHEMTSFQRAFTQAAELAGEIKLACLPSFAERWLPEVLLAFQKIHPKVAFKVEASDRIVDLIDEKIDVAIRVQEPRGADYVYRKLTENTLMLVASPQYLKRAGEPKSVAELHKHPVLMLPAYTKCKFVREKFPLSNLENRQAIVSQSGPFLTALALAGAGIAVRSSWDVQRLVAGGKLVQVLPKAQLESFGNLYLVTGAKARINRRTAEFAEFATSYLQRSIAGK